MDEVSDKRVASIKVRIAARQMEQRSAWLEVLAASFWLQLEYTYLETKPLKRKDLRASVTVQEMGH